MVGLASLVTVNGCDLKAEFCSMAVPGTVHIQGEISANVDLVTHRKAVEDEVQS